MMQKKERIIWIYIPETDVMGIRMRPFEDYYFNEYSNKKLNTTYLLDF